MPNTRASNPEFLPTSFRRGRLADPGRIAVMGILNVTPDSFSDGGRFNGSGAEAVAAGLAMLADGADLLDIGGESTRPGAAPVAAAEESARVVPVIRELARRTQAPLSVDTRHLDTARAALDAGADIVNDVSALRLPFPRPDGGDGLADHGELASLIAGGGAVVILMHAHGIPATRRAPEGSGDVNAPEAVAAWLRSRAEYAESRGVEPGRIWLDPGFGFGKDFSGNARLLRELSAVTRMGYPVLAGLSRKSLIGDALGLPVSERMEASVALAVLAAWQGARIVRVHDVRATRRALDMVRAIEADA